MDNNNIGELVRKQEQDYISSPTSISKYVDFNMYETINTIEAYLNSKHISGSEDSLGREKPFFNIVTAVANIWMRATDIDRKNIKIKPTKSKDVVASFLATVHLQDWMRKINFGSFLNEWGRSLSRYGSSVVKFVEKDGQLYPMVIPWARLITDPIDFDAAPVIEVLELTPAQLRKNKGYDKQMVEELIEAQSARKGLDGVQDDNRDGFIRVYEVHGELPLSFITGKDKDDDTYVQQMHTVSFVAKKNSKDYDDYTLVKGREDKNPYMITHLIKEDGRTLSIGAVENLFDAQWMMNHTVKAMKDQLDLASKLIFQSSDASFVGQNALQSIETGDILIHAPNEPLTQVNNGSHDLSSNQNYGQMWKQLSQEISNTPDALMGNNAPSGTAWRQVEALQQEAHSLFELMTENKGLAVEDMMTHYVLPFVKTKMNTTKEVATTLEGYDIQKIDEMYINAEVIRRGNKKIIEDIFNGLIAEAPDTQALTQEVQGELDQQGNQRFFSPEDVPNKKWSEVFKDLEWDVEVDITGEQKANQEDLATLNTIFGILASNPQALENKNTKMIFNKILEKTGTVSPMELNSQPEPQTPPQGSPQPLNTPSPTPQPIPS